MGGVPATVIVTITVAAMTASTGIVRLLSFHPLIQFLLFSRFRQHDAKPICVGPLCVFELFEGSKPRNSRCVLPVGLHARQCTICPHISNVLQTRVIHRPVAWQLASRRGRASGIGPI